MLSVIENMLKNLQNNTKGEAMLFLIIWIKTDPKKKSWNKSVTAIFVQYFLSYRKIITYWNKKYQNIENAIVIEMLSVIEIYRYDMLSIIWAKTDPIKEKFNKIYYSKICLLFYQISNFEVIENIVVIEKL